MGSWETKRAKLNEPYKEFFIKYQKIQGNCLNEAANKNNVAKNVILVYSVTGKRSQVQPKGLGKSV